jgi:hypothetical protein
MDIMNNMTVSTSKLTFTLIAIATLFIAGSAFTNQEASAAVTFTATHNTTTQTDVTFNENVNGTLNTADWKITATGARGEVISATITYISNSSSHPITHMNNAGNSNLINRTIGPIFIHHSAIPSDATLNINYTAQENASGVHVGASNGLTDGLGFVSDAIRNVVGSNEVFMVAALDVTANDEIIPTALSAEILKSNPKQIRILMSEKVGNLNATDSAFTLVTSSFGSNGVANRENVVSSFNSNNGTTLTTSTTDKYIYVNMVNNAKEGDIFTIAYSQIGNGVYQWITDAINSDFYADNQGTGAGGATNHGFGNRLANFSAITIVNYVNTDGVVGSLDNCYDCSPPQVTKVQVSLDSSIPITVTNDNPVKINAGIGDTVTLMVTVADDSGAANIPFAGLYTNFGETPDNLFYANNFDSTKKMSTSYYEWNIRDDDVAFDNDGAITWTDATAKVNADRTKTITYTMNINDSVDSSQVWVDIGDKIGNYAKLSLPVTLEVSGAPAITFASDDSQKVVSFFNESILLAIVSQWTTTSSNDASNVEQLSSVLGIENQLPTWTTDLASWVADDKIDVADMIVAVEYVINQ